MSKSSLLLCAILLSAFGMAVITGHPPWGAVTGIAILFSAAAMAAGAMGKPSPGLQAAEQRAAGQKIPATLVTLSATAILAVYAAGYQRTRDAAESFEAQSARRQPVPASVVAPLPTPLGATGSAAAAHTQAPPQQHTTIAAGQLPAPAPAPETPNTPGQASEPVSPSSQAAAATPAPPPEPTPTPSQPAAAPNASAASAAAKSEPTYKDGTFLGWGRCRHGSIQASVAINGGQIVSTEIAQCLTRYSCSWIANLPGQVVTRQSANVDYVSGATESTDAFYDAVASALAMARE